MEPAWGHSHPQGGAAETKHGDTPAQSNRPADGWVPFSAAAEGAGGLEEWVPIEAHGKHFIDLSQLLLGQKFASGTYGQLFRGLYDGQEVAVKILKQPENEAEEDAANGQDMEHQCRQEVDMLSRLSHTNVLRFVGACKRPPQWVIITEYMSGGDLRGLLNRQEGQPLPLPDVLHLGLEIARGMHYLHDKGVVHRDLKPDNLLLSSDKRTLVVSDFGVSRIEASAVMTAETGTYRWMAPEMIDHRPYTRKVDVYSFAIVLWELYTMELPFNGMSAVQAAFAVVNKQARPQIPAHCPPVLARLIQTCWHSDPDRRPAFDVVVRKLEEMLAFLESNSGHLESMAVEAEPEDAAPTDPSKPPSAVEPRQKKSFLCCFG